MIVQSNVAANKMTKHCRVIELSTQTQVAECSGANVNTRYSFAHANDVAIYHAIETNDRIEKAAEGLRIFDGRLTAEEAKRYANHGREVMVHSSGFAVEIEGEIRAVFATRHEAESYLTAEKKGAAR